MAKEKKDQEAKAEIKKPEAKPKEKKTKLVLKKTLHIPNINKKGNIERGEVLTPGTNLTADQVKAYEKARDKVGGQTKIERFCK